MSDNDSEFVSIAVRPPFWNALYLLNNIQGRRNKRTVVQQIKYVMVVMILFPTGIVDEQESDLLRQNQDESVMYISAET